MPPADSLQARASGPRLLIGRARLGTGRAWRHGAGYSIWTATQSAVGWP